MIARGGLKLAGPVCNHLHHSFVKFIVAYLVVIITIYLVHDLIPKILIAFLKRCLAERSVEDGPNFVLADEAVAILVKNVKCNSQVFSIKKSGSINSGSDELLVVNLAILISIELVHQIVPVLAAGPHGSQNLTHALLELI